MNMGRVGSHLSLTDMQCSMCLLVQFIWLPLTLSSQSLLCAGSQALIVADAYSWTDWVYNSLQEGGSWGPLSLPQ